MAREKSEDRRTAILAAAMRVIERHGLGASTAVIAKEAGVPHGSVFTYFETKAELLNAVYVDLKSGVAVAALKGFVPDGEGRKQCFHVWSNWMGWAIAHPKRRRALAMLEAAGEITAKSRAAGKRAMAPMEGMLERVHGHGAMRGAPMELLMALMNSVAEGTMEVMAQDRAHADGHARAGFEALWRMIG